MALQVAEEAGAHDEDAAGGQLQQEEQKVPVVEEADAVVDPRAVVVHLQHAPVAHRAVVRARRLGHAAPLAEAHARHRRVARRPLRRRLDRREVVAGEARPGEQAAPIVEEDVEEEVDAKRVHEPAGNDAVRRGDVHGRQAEYPLHRHERDEAVGKNHL